jgi:hypothetical protein
LNHKNFILSKLFFYSKQIIDGKVVRCKFDESEIVMLKLVDVIFEKTLVVIYSVGKKVTTYSVKI